MYVLNKIGFNLKPKYIFYCFFKNDIEDLSTYRSKEQMRTFIATPADEIEFPEHIKYKAFSISNPLLHSLVSHFIRGPFIFVALRLGAMDAMNFFKKYFSSIKGKSYSENVPSNEFQKIFGKKYLLEWEYTLKAILQMKNSSDEHSAQFIIAPIKATKRRYQILQAIASEYNIRLLKPKL